MTEIIKNKLLSRLTVTGKSLRWSIMAVLLVAAFIPLILAGFGSWVVFGDLLEQKSVEIMRGSVMRHADAIEAYLLESRHLLEAMSETHDLDEITESSKLQLIFENLNGVSNKGFVDLGVIDAEGRHRAYVGPYDLQNRNYSQADWFSEVLVRGHYISDVFMGYREVPHCVIAVRTSKGGRVWILRATINSAKFDELVQSGFSAGRGEVFIVNSGGVYQTTPIQGGLLEQSTLSDIEVHSGVRDVRVEAEGQTKIRVMTWINDNRWLLVVQQDLGTVQAPVNQAIARGAYVVILAAVILIIITFLATWYLTHRIDRVTAEREKLSRAFVRSAKLASIGELTTGLAHEINNPLAIISAEQTNIADIIKDEFSRSGDYKQALDSVARCQNQVKRCATITRKLLQFGRSKESSVEAVKLAPRLEEIKTLLDRQASLRNVEIELNLEDDLPEVMADPIELEQVIVNLINNAMDAMPQGGRIAISAGLDKNRILLQVADTGAGIEPDIVDRIFEPFFTTKPVGQGTGLGLSVCYGIVHSWGGTIEVESKIGVGTNFRLTLDKKS